MSKTGIDREQLIHEIGHASARQGETVRRLVHETTLKALQARELTLANVRQVLNEVSKGVAGGAADNHAAGAVVEKLIAKAVTGMDQALVQAVEAHRKALQQFVVQGVDLGEGPLKKVMADLGKMEATFFSALRQAAAKADVTLQGPWSHVLETFGQKGSGAGMLASTTLEELVASAQENLEEGRRLGLSASRALLDGYTTLVSGVLIGMSDAMLQGRPAQRATLPVKSVSGQAAPAAVAKKAVPARTAVKGATPNKAAPKKTATKTAVRKKATVKKAAPRKAAPRKAAPKKAAPRKAVPKKAAGKKSTSR